jgi:hypothetical protein
VLFITTTLLGSVVKQLDGGFIMVLLVNNTYDHTRRFLIIGDHTMNRTSKRRAWTTAHVRELKLLARKKTPAKKIAKTLKRSEGATRQKAFIIGLSLDARA